MKKLDSTRLWALIYNPPVAVASTDAKAILDEFTEELQDYCRNESNFAERTRTLNYARIDLRSHLESFQTGAGEKCIAA